MNFRWNDDTVRWYLAADAYTGYSEKLAALIAPMVEGLSTLCDVGCGLGLIDLALSRHLEKITCIDVSAAAIDALKQAVAVKKIGNIEPLLMDSADLLGYWDVILLSFFDSHNIGAYLPRCRKLIASSGQKTKASSFPTNTERSGNIRPVKRRNFWSETVFRTNGGTPIWTLDNPFYRLRTRGNSSQPGLPGSRRKTSKLFYPKGLLKPATVCIRTACPGQNPSEFLKSKETSRTMHIFLTGEIMIGKTVAIEKTISILDVVPGGFKTYFGPDRDAAEKDLYMNPAAEPMVFRKENAIVHFTDSFHPQILTDRFETYGVSLIRKAKTNQSSSSWTNAVFWSATPCSSRGKSSARWTAASRSWALSSWRASHGQRESEIIRTSKSLQSTGKTETVFRRCLPGGWPLKWAMNT
jgi:hypothetical protein